MEILIAVAVVLLSCLGLCLGLILGGKPIQTACEGVSCIGGGRCEVCPRRLAGKANVGAGRAQQGEAQDG